MKNIILIVALIVTTSLMAQKKPQFEKEGSLVKGTFFHDNGQILQQGFYKNGKLHGEWVSFNAAGEKLALAQYESGKKIGKWFVWTDGILTEVDYKANEIASVTEWSEKNTLVARD